MNRRRKSQNSYIGKERRHMEMLTRHRFADTKYRSKVQFFFELLKDFLPHPTDKDNLLKYTLCHIKNLENEICELTGMRDVNEYKQEFINFLQQEEALWKNEKDLEKWRAEVCNLLGNKLNCQLPDTSLEIDTSVFGSVQEQQNKKESSPSIDTSKNSTPIMKPRRKKSLKNSPKRLTKKTNNYCSGKTVKCRSRLPYSMEYNLGRFSSHEANSSELQETLVFEDESFLTTDMPFGPSSPMTSEDSSMYDNLLIYPSTYVTLECNYI